MTRGSRRSLSFWVVGWRVRIGEFSFFQNGGDPDEAEQTERFGKECIGTKLESLVGASGLVGVGKDYDFQARKCGVPAHAFEDFKTT